MRRGWNGPKYRDFIIKGIEMLVNELNANILRNLVFQEQVAKVIEILAINIGSVGSLVDERKDVVDFRLSVLFCKETHHERKGINHTRRRAECIG